MMRATYGGLEISLPKSRSRLAELYWRHAPDALRLAYLVTGDHHLAEDIVQDAFVRAFGRWRDLRNPNAFGSYLRRTVVNLSRDHFRKLQRERGHLHDFVEPDHHEVGPSTRIELQDELLRALRKLPVRQRAAVVLRYCEGLSEHEVADVLDTTVGAVNSLVARGLASLRGERGGVQHERS
jgi:RNA polymerase sigma-70 factor (sigma-E family)